MTITDKASNFTVNIPTFLDDYTVQNGGNYSLEYNLQFQVQTSWTSWTTTYYAGSQVYFNTDIRSDGSCRVFAASEGDSLMQIGTNGLVYSVGNGDYFYSGEDGIEMNFKQNKISFNEEDGLKIMHKPQVLTREGEIVSELCLCKPSSSGYTVRMPAFSEEGRRFTIFGFIGLQLNAWSDRPFRVYRRDLNTYSEISSIKFVNASSSLDNYILNLYATKIELISMDGGWYINQTIL